MDWKNRFKRHLDDDTDIPLKSLTADELLGFASAMQKEAKSMLIDNHALEALTHAASEEIRRTKPEKILPTRWHYKRKTIEDDQGGVTKAMAAMKHRSKAADFMAAFLQSRPTTREIYVSQPTEGVPGVEPDVLLKMMVEVYGSTSGPASWRSTIVPPTCVHGETNNPSSIDIEQLKHGSGDIMLPKTALNCGRTLCTTEDIQTE
eukprot:4674434-Amphidinium_carterae.3